MTSITGKTPRSILAALAFVFAMLIPAAVAQAGSGGIGTDPAAGTGGTGTGTGTSTGDSGATIEGLNPSYAKFVGIVADNTDLSLRVLGAWSLAEGGPKDNPLNIGPGHRFGTVRKGAAATTDLLSESLYSKILASAGEPDSTQIRAIARSSWCPGCKGYERLLRRTYSSVEVVDEP